MSKEKEDNEVLDKQKKKKKQELVEFKGQQVPKEELEFWKKVTETDDSFLKSAKVAKRTGRIEDAISQGTVSTYKQLERSTYLNESHIRAWAIWGDYPIVQKILLREMGLQRHLKGQHQDKLLEFYKMHAQQEEEAKWRKKFTNFANSIKTKLGMI
jgi:hypothetical protein